MSPPNLIKVAEAMLPVLRGIFPKDVETKKKRGRKPSSLSEKIVLFFVKHLKKISSERDLERKLNGEYRKLLRLLGLKQSPDHSTFSVWRKELYQILDEVRRGLIKKAVELGVIRGKLIAVDSTAFKAYCNPRKKNLSDEDAAWGYLNEEEKIFGYKLHLAVDAETELPVAGVVLPANEHDSKGFFPVFEKTFEELTYLIQKIIADSAYDSSEIRIELRKKSIKPVIAVNGRGHCLSSDPKDADYSKRTSIERVNSRCKLELGLDDLKLRSLPKAAFHASCVIVSMLFAAIGSFLAGFKDFRRLAVL